MKTKEEDEYDEEEDDLESNASGNREEEDLSEDSEDSNSDDSSLEDDEDDDIPETAQVGKKRGRATNSKKPSKVSTSASAKRHSKNPNIVEVNGLKIDIEKITDQEMYALRKVLPRKDYRLLKNRKSARKSRKRRKVELSTLRDEIRALKHENHKLRRQVEEEIDGGA